MTPITLIESPIYQIDLSVYAPKTLKEEPLSSLQTVQKIGFLVFKSIKLLIISYKEASVSTLKNLSTSFSLIVLGRYRGFFGSYAPPTDLPLALIKTVYWMGTITLSTASSTIRLYNEKMNPNKIASDQRYLENYVSEEINTSHIRCEDLDLDVSEVPPSVQVDTLLSMLESVNFTDPTKPGYVKPSSRVEKCITYTPEQLKESLTTYVNHIKGRTPFLGTPKAADTERLLSFYQQIEDATRLCLHKEILRLKEFQDKNGSDINAYDDTQMQAYKNILEDRARLVIDLAIAGNHCGGRYMGDVMESYYSRYRNTQSNDTSLQSSLYQLLAQKRGDIARQQIDKHFGSDSESTHRFSDYFENYGQILAIPGTKNISDAFGRPLDDSIYLKDFFKEYTVNTILDTLQQGFKESQSLREKLTDWLRDQVNEWNQDAYSHEKLNEQIQEVLKEEISARTQIDECKDLQLLITHLKQCNVDLHKLWDDSGKDWDCFLNEVLAQDQAKTWYAERHTGKSRPQLMRQKNFLKTVCSADSLGHELLHAFKNYVFEGLPISVKMIEQQFNLLVRIQKIRKIKGLETINSQVLARTILANNDLHTIVKDYLEIERRSHFLAALNLESIGKTDLSPEIMEWIAVSHSILNPQLD